MEKVVNQVSNLQIETSPLPGSSRTQDTIRRTLSSLGRRGTDIAESFLSTVLPEVGSKSKPTIELTEATPIRKKETRQRNSKGKQKMATTTTRTRRVRVQNTPEVTGAFPVTSPEVIRTRGSQTIKKSPQKTPVSPTIKRTSQQTKNAEMSLQTYYQSQPIEYNGNSGGPPGNGPGGNPDGNPDDDPDDSDNDNDNDHQEDDNVGHENEEEEQEDIQPEEPPRPGWLDSRWTPASEINPLSAFSTHKKPKIPVPPTNNGEDSYTKSATFDNWTFLLLDYLKVHNINTESDEGLAYVSGYLDGIGREFLINWKKEHQGTYQTLINFLDDLRKFCIPPNYEEKLWQEFNEIRQTMHGRSKPIKQVATELLTMKMRIPKLTTTQMYYQFKTAMDPDLEALISPYIHPDMAWNEIVDMAVRYDTALKNKNKQKSTTNYSKKPSFQRNFNKNNNWNNKPKNFNKPLNKPFNKSNNTNRSFSNHNKSKNFNHKPKRDLATVTCYNCNEKGHYANKCPKKSIKSAAQTVQPRRTNPFPRKPFIKSAATEVTDEQEHLPPELYDKNSKHMVIDVLINGNPARALVDQQTTRANLISTSYATTYNLPLVQFKEDLAIQLSLQGSRGKSTHYVKTKLTIGQHEEMASFCVAALSDWDLILAEPLLRKLKAIVNIADHSMTIKPSSDLKPTIIKATSNRHRMTPPLSSTTISSASTMVSADHIDGNSKDNNQALDQWITKVIQKIEDPDCKWGSGLLKSRLCFLTSKKHKQDYKQRRTTTWG